MNKYSKKTHSQNSVFQSIINYVPNTLTCGNIVCGCIGIIQIFKGDLALACYFVFVGAIFDFVDGLAARVLQVQSTLGKDLDSLADMTTFGVLPGLMMYQLLNILSTNDLIPFVGILIPVFSAIRLAKFNNDTRQTSEFYGLPTPANALFFISFTLIMIFEHSEFKRILLQPYLLCILIVVFCLLMVSEIKLFSLKIKTFNISDNIYVVILFLSANLLFYFLFFSAIPFIIILYIILSIVKNNFEK